MDAAHPQRRWNGLWLVAGIFAGTGAFALGFALGSRTEPRASESVETTRAVQREPHPDLTPLRDELRRLREEFERFAAARHERVPVATTVENDSLDALRRAVEALADSSRAPSARSDALSSMKTPMPELIARLGREYAALAPPYPGREAGSEEWKQWQAWWDPWSDAKRKQIASAHSLWTPEDVIAAYGRPDRIEPDARPNLCYTIARASNVDVQLQFQFDSGYTSSVWLQPELREN
jgi:hypothetical protein